MVVQDISQVRLYSDERTAEGQYVESLLRKYDIPYSQIPTSGSLPRINGPGFLSFDFRCPSDRDEDFEPYLRLIKKRLEKQVND
ncbi:MAG: hypothetical protein KKA65_05450 [Nanoarchaeota archaeon]|nr:hypothetical protein [Nanoarchaeota archaeon]MBU4456916.1 hypothetical protein [Nanoarchaeota archaeon]MCG2719482.1 hypothetical protein [Nanoarchaeota archaeon]